MTDTPLFPNGACFDYHCAPANFILSTVFVSALSPGDVNEKFIGISFNSGSVLKQVIETILEK